MAFLERLDIGMQNGRGMIDRRIDDTVMTERRTSGNDRPGSVCATSARGFFFHTRPFEI